MKILVILVMLLLSFTSSASQLVVFPVSTSIDKSEFIPYVITEMSFSPSSINLLTNKENTRFEDGYTMLVIKTDIPTSDNSIKFQLVLIENIAKCYDFNKVIIETSPTFSNLFIDDSELIIGEAIPIEFNGNEKGTQYFTKQLSIAFEEFPDNAVNCSGEFELYSELTL